MFSPDQYELVDFGSARKLERFGPWLLDRPSPAAEGYFPECADAWRDAQAVFQRESGERGVWHNRDNVPTAWTIAHGALVFELRRTDFGHIGLFAEQATNWDWLAEQIHHANRPLKVLNLFAYTGGSTLAAAQAGAEVVHIDAARNVVQWARRNAELSGLGQQPIRWIAEDALKFVQRELRRGNAYDAVILDPPSYGHGPNGEVWKLSEHLPELLTACQQLTANRLAFVLLSCHTPGYGDVQLQRLLHDHFGAAQVETTELELRMPCGRALPSGVAARFTTRP